MMATDLNACTQRAITLRQVLTPKKALLSCGVKWTGTENSQRQ
jgi:hypothetical protein